MDNKYFFFSYLKKIVVIACIFFMSGCESDCLCESISVELVIQDENGEPAVADSVVYTVDGIEETIPESQLEESNVISIGSTAGTYHIWVTIGEQQWESDDIEIEMGGPEDCRRPSTQQITVTFGEDMISSDIVPIEIC